MTIRNILLTAALCLCAIGCNSDNSEHLPAQKMEQIMFDISIAEAYSTKGKDNTNFGGLKNLDSLSIYYKDIFAHHQVTQEQFTQSVKWYKAHVDDLDSIYTHLSARADKISAEEAKKKKIIQPEQTLLH